MAPRTTAKGHRGPSITRMLGPSNTGITPVLFPSCVCVWVNLSVVTLCDPMDCSLPGSSVHGILQTRILEWAAIPFSRVFSPTRDWTQVSWIAGRFFTVWATREAVSPFLGDLIPTYALLQALFPWPVEQSLRLSEISLGVLSEGLHYDPHLQGFPVFKDGSCFSEEPPLPWAMGGGRPHPRPLASPHLLLETLLGQSYPRLSFNFSCDKKWVVLHQVASDDVRTWKKTKCPPQGPKNSQQRARGRLGGESVYLSFKQSPLHPLALSYFFFMGMKNTFLILKCFLMLETHFVYIIIFKVIFNSIIFNIQDLILCLSFSKDRWLKKHPR